MRHVCDDWVSWPSHHKRYLYWIAQVLNHEHNNRYLCPSVDTGLSASSEVRHRTPYNLVLAVHQMTPERWLSSFTFSCKMHRFNPHTLQWRMSAQNKWETFSAVSTWCLQTKCNFDPPSVHWSPPAGFCFDQAAPLCWLIWLTHAGDPLGSQVLQKSIDDRVVSGVQLVSINPNVEAEPVGVGIGCQFPSLAELVYVALPSPGEKKRDKERTER